MQKDLGLVTAYGAALEGGYTGTFEDYKTKMLELLDFQIQDSYDDTELRQLIDNKANKTDIPSAYDDTDVKDRIAALENAGYQNAAQVESTAAAEVAKLVANAPQNYDTLKEIADYISTDVTNAAIMANDIAGLKSGKVDKNSLATVATSGSYNDLSNKPTIPTNTDAKVAQTNTTTNSNYRILFSNTASDSTLTEGARKSGKLLFNPSTGTLTVNKIIGETSGTIFSYLGVLSKINSELEYSSTAKELLLLFATDNKKYGSQYYSSGIIEIRHVPLSIKTDTGLGSTGNASSFYIEGINSFKVVTSVKWNQTYGRYDLELLSSNRFSGIESGCEINMNTRVVKYSEYVQYVLNKDFTGFTPTYYNPGDEAPCVYVYYK